MTTRPKFFQIVAGAEVPIVYPRFFQRSGEQLLIAASDGAIDLMLALAEPLQAEDWLISYALLEDDSQRTGRYESPWMSFDAAQTILRDFQPFFESDGRHNVALLSKPIFLNYTQHALIQAAGQIDETLLSSRGYSEGPLDIPFPHAHGFQEDAEATLRCLLQTTTWKFSPSEETEP